MSYQPGYPASGGYSTGYPAQPGFVTAQPAVSSASPGYYNPQPSPAMPSAGGYYNPQPQTIIVQERRDDDCAKDCCICALCAALCCFCCSD